MLREIRGSSPRIWFRARVLCHESRADSVVAERLNLITVLSRLSSGITLFSPVCAFLRAHRSHFSPLAFSLLIVIWNTRL